MKHWNHALRLAAFAALTACAPVDGLDRDVAAISYTPATRRQQPMADFNGDRFADYASFDTATGLFTVMANLRNGAFAANGASGHAEPTMTRWEQWVGDFTGDGLGDFADHNLATGAFFVHRNLGNGTFAQTVTWGTATTRVGAGWEALVADFTGDGAVDFADRNLTTGEFFVRRNRRDGTFDGLTERWGRGLSHAGSGWETVVADFTGDRYADYAERNLATGEMWIHENLRNGTFAEAATLNRVWGYAKTAGGVEYATIVGDFTGDGFADFADVSRTYHTFYVHENLRNGAFAGFGVNWGTGLYAPLLFGVNAPGDPGTGDPGNGGDCPSAPEVPCSIN